jgi:hypothetical protein
MGHIFPAQVCFDYQRLSDFFAQLQVVRVKGIINTNTGWFAPLYKLNICI